MLHLKFSGKSWRGNTMKLINFWFNKDIKSVKLDPFIKRKVIAHHENIMMVEVSFETGGIGQLHNHVHEQATYVLSGKFEFEIGGLKQIIEKGDSVYLEPNVMHGCVCLESGILLDVFTPHRADFINK